MGWLFVGWLIVEQRVTPELLGRLLDEHGGALALYAAQWTDSPDDCVQEALIELARQPQAPTSPLGWLYRVVRNRAISQLRSAHRRHNNQQLAMRLRPVREGEAIRESEAPAEPSVDSAELTAALDFLPPDIREVVIARTWGELNFEQIAELTGCSTSTAHRRYEAGLIALRERLQPPCPLNTNITNR